MPTQKKVPRKTAKKTVQNDIKNYRCVCCGKEVADPMNVFYKLSYSPLHKGNDAYSHICISCIRELFEKYSKKYSTEFATKYICALLNVPFYRSLYEAINKARDDFSFGYYIRQINARQYQGHTFALTLANNELAVTKAEAEQEADEIAEKRWTVDERRAKTEVIRMMGYDPFDGYHPKDRRVLFSELNNYLNDEELLSDNYKLSQIIQLINNNNQINQYDIAISKLDARTDIAELKTLNNLKKELVANNEKIAKENGISVKSRGEQKTGRGTLTGLMRDMREKNLGEIEANFYDQLQSANTRWAIDISMQSMMDNCAFDENDINDIIEHQRTRMLDLKEENDDLKEEKRIFKTWEKDAKEYIAKLEKKIQDMGGDLDD